jgi:hypothetical protein
MVSKHKLTNIIFVLSEQKQIKKKLFITIQIKKSLKNKNFYFQTLLSFTHFKTIFIVLSNSILFASFTVSCRDGARLNKLNGQEPTSKKNNKFNNNKLFIHLFFKKKKKKNCHLGIWIQGNMRDHIFSSCPSIFI